MTLVPSLCHEGTEVAGGMRRDVSLKALDVGSFDFCDLRHVAVPDVSQPLVPIEAACALQQHHCAQRGREDGREFGRVPSAGRRRCVPLAGNVWIVGVGRQVVFELLALLQRAKQRPHADLPRTGQVRRAIAVEELHERCGPGTRVEEVQKITGVKNQFRGVPRLLHAVNRVLELLSEPRIAHVLCHLPQLHADIFVLASS